MSASSLGSRRSCLREAAETPAQEWTGESNYVFAPVSKLTRIVQLLHEWPLLRATVVAPHWPAQACFRSIRSGTTPETRPAATMSAQHALPSAMLTPPFAAGTVGAPLLGSRLPELSVTLAITLGLAATAGHCAVPTHLTRLVSISDPFLLSVAT